MTQPTNYADMVRSQYGRVYRCRCGLVVYPNGTDWRDGSGSEWCWSLNQHHSGRMEGSTR